MDLNEQFNKVSEKVDLLKFAINDPAIINSRKSKLQSENDLLKAQIAETLSQISAIEKSNGKIVIKLQTHKQPSKIQAQPNAKGDAPQKQNLSENSDSQQKLTPKPKVEKKQKIKKENVKSNNKQPEQKPVNLSRVKLIIGQIVEVKYHPDAPDGLYVETMELGESKPRTILSGLVRHVPIEQMKNRKVICVANLKPQKLVGIFSEGMVLCGKKKIGEIEKVEFINVPDCAVPGDIVTTDDFLENDWSEPDLPFLNKKKKIFETIQPDFSVDGDKIACWKGKPLLIKGKENETRGKFTSDSIIDGNIS